MYARPIDFWTQVHDRTFFITMWIWVCSKVFSGSTEFWKSLIIYLENIWNLRELEIQFALWYDSYEMSHPECEFGDNGEMDSVHKKNEDEMLQSKIK